jgi:hypothetical protein
VLAHAEVQIATLVAPAATGGALGIVILAGRRIEIAESLQRGVRGRIEIR